MSRTKTTTTTKTEKKKKRKKKREERGKKEQTLSLLLLCLLLLRAFSSSFPPLDAIFGRLFLSLEPLNISFRAFAFFSTEKKRLCDSFAILAHIIIIEQLFFVLKYKNVCLIIDCCDSRGALFSFCIARFFPSFLIF